MPKDGESVTLYIILKLEIYPMRQLKKFFLKTYGCQMNELDSEIMVGLPSVVKVDLAGWPKAEGAASVAAPSTPEAPGRTTSRR